MNRQEFLKSCKENLDIKESFFYLDVDVLSYDDKEEFAKELIKKMSPIVSILGIEPQETTKFVQSISYKKEYDSYYEEDNPDSEVCRFNCLLNLHEIYDRYLVAYSTDLPNKTIYRVEKADGYGLYDGRFAREKVEIERHPAPGEDPAFGELFKYDLTSKNVKYQKNWSFGFSSIDDAKNWVNDTDMIDQLRNDGYVLKEITLPSDFVIEGYKQTIFQKRYVLKEESLDLNILRNSRKLTL
jgi:disulfide oxidoreductase YuzD